MIVGIVFAVLCALSKAIDTLLNKSVMRNVSAANHAIYRIVFVTPVLLIAACLNWRLEIACLPYVLLYGVLESINIFTHQLAVKRSNPLHIEIISKSKVIFTLILSLVLVIDTLSFWSTIGIAVFMVGTVLTINFQSRGEDERTDMRGIGLEITSVLARTFKPFILKSCIQKGLTSNETMAFLSMIVAFLVLLAVFRPKLSYKEISVPKYSAQALIVGLGMLLSGWAITRANIVVVNAIESTTIIFIMTIGYLFYKKKYSALTVIGSLISVVGIVLAIVL